MQHGNKIGKSFGFMVCILEEGIYTSLGDKPEMGKRLQGGQAQGFNAEQLGGTPLSVFGMALSWQTNVRLSRDSRDI